MYQHEETAMTQATTAQTPGELPIACTLTADEQAAWSAGIGRTVFTQYEEARALPDGYALRYPGDATWAQTLMDFIIHERECCTFFAFALTFEPNHGAIWLHLTGGNGVKEFVAGMIGSVRE
jgi:hypothetical protein